MSVREIREHQNDEDEIKCIAKALLYGEMRLPQITSGISQDLNP